VYLLFTLLLCQPSFVKAHGDGEFKVEKKKTYSKSYAITGSDKIKLDNSFGEMRILTWDKNEVKVDISITAKANTEEAAQKLLDNIRIQDGKEGNTVYFKTEMSNKNKSWSIDDDDNSNKSKNNKSYKNTGMEINYTVYMPAGNALEAINSFGPMIVPDLTGSTSITSKFGSLTCGKLSNNKEVVVEFGKADFKHINGGDISIKFSNADFNKLSGAVDANFEFSKSTTITLDNSLKSLNLKNSYSTIELVVDKDFSADFDIKTNFGSFKNYSGINISEEKDDGDDRGPKFDHRYSGKNGSGAARVKIKSSFGTIKIS
jgi:hypothetical protein